MRIIGVAGGGATIINHPALIGPIVDHPARLQQAAHVDIGRIGDKTIAYAGSRRFAAFHLRVKRFHRIAQHIDFGFAVAGIGLGH